MILDPNTNAGGGGYGWNIDGPLPPPGQYVAVCLDVRDSLGVDRPSWDNPQVMEKKDVTRFLFGAVHPQTRQPFLVQTFEYTISGGANSNLVKFLKGWTGKDPYGFDYAKDLKGVGAMITVQHKHSTRNPSVVYANIAGISPVYPTLQGEIPNPATFAALIAQANQPRQQTAGQQTTGPAGVRKFWTQGPTGVVLVTQQQLITKGEPNRLVMTEDQSSGWVPASSLMPFGPPAAPTAPPMPPAPPAAPAPPAPPTFPTAPAAPAAPAGWGVPPPPASLPQTPEEELPF